MTEGLNKLLEVIFIKLLQLLLTIDPLGIFFLYENFYFVGTQIQKYCQCGYKFSYKVLYL